MLKRSYNLTKIMGIPIRVHLTLVILLIAVALFSGLYGIIIAVGLLASVALHELGHSWVAQKYGCHVREIMLLPIGGVAKMSSIPSQPRAEIFLALAGPLVSFVLASLFAIVADQSFKTLLLGPRTSFAGYFGFINLMLGLFNLLPSFPMDGGRVFRAVMTPKIGRLKATELAAKIGKRMSIAFGIIGLFGIPHFILKPFGISGHVPPSFMLILIAIFIYNAAGAEYRSVYARHMQQEWFTVGEQQADIHVSPPPYAQKGSLWKEWKRKTHDFFNDLFKNWE